MRGRGYGGGGRGRLYTYRYTVGHQNDFCIKMGSDESHFNVSVGSDGQSHKTVSTNHNLLQGPETRTTLLAVTGLSTRTYLIRSTKKKVHRVLNVHRNHKAY